LRRSISIVIPAYNEEKRLPATLAAVQAYVSSTPWEFTEIVVVDDGSRDNTREIARQAGVRVLQNPGNRGKGYSVRHGMLEAKGDWLLFSDADLSTPIEELAKLWSAIEREGAQAAIGSRDLDRSLIGVRQPLFRELGGRFFNLVIRLMTGLPFRDTQCGFKLFERTAAREIYRRQRVERFGFDVEVLFIAQRLGYRILEVPVRWNDEAGTTVKMMGALAAFLDPVKVRWNGIAGKYK
jgi:dolichyl-phosphate beta-glucosyltransferase